MDSNQGTTDRITDFEQIRSRFIHARPIVVIRRLRSEIHHEQVRVLMNMSRDSSSLSMLQTETRYRTNSNSYEYYVSGIGWMSKHVYSQFKQHIIKENW